ncbi:Auxilin-like protein and related proteins containing DnaJ domain [Handroanthus impetiginosus]|uniref:Auxilin-like protein and related proteins containing DnaJ domain n=1 Tax=Handroanthus impetiginosus TaxID=429701 RepID=A0A2G9HY70_9LAMI|nr:Auxilin-like protein and related proteins containing DnaJ domain [Handroanthus impetiginosus]
MDESWRMRIGMPTPKLSNNPPRRSTQDPAAVPNLKNSISDDPLNPDDFTDVFGGPPRTILSRQFSADFRRSSSFFYDDIFRQPYKEAHAGGRNLPEFRIPSGKQRSSDFKQRCSRNNGYYSDVFGWDDERVVRSRSRSKASSSSAMSSEELSPLRPAISDDGYDDVSLFASKLRPINVRSKWNSRRFGQEDYTKQEKLQTFEDYPFRRNASAESTIDLDPITNRSFRMPAEDVQFNSPSSAVSSVSDRDMNTCETVDVELEEEECMLSYVIEINSDKRELQRESNGVDEAIAWAKEMFQTKCLEEKVTEQRKDSSRLVDEKQDESAGEEEEEEEIKVQTEMQLLDEKIRLWSTGKETDIRLLLSSLHHILWSNSGWVAMPLMNIIEISQVKKAYQKAQLCLHPDKLQQRGATITQKYIAQKIFAVLQDAWAAFVAEDEFSR